VITSQLTEWVKTQLNNGLNPETIKNQLANSKWSSEDITQVFNLVSNNQLPEPKSRKRSIILPITIVVLLLALVVGLIFLFVIKKSFVSITAQVPNYIPAGFAIEGEFQVQKNGNKDAIVIGYNNPTKGEIVFTQRLDSTFTCTAPSTSNSLTDYRIFRLANGAEACAVTGFGKDRLYNWASNGVWFTLKAKNLCIDDSEFEKIANSLKEKSVKAFITSK